MPYSSTAELLALHGLRLKGFAQSHEIAQLVGLDEPSVTRELAKAAETDLTMFREGRRTGWTLKPAGRIENERLLAAELDAAGVRSQVMLAYRGFLAMNSTMLAVCTRWQVKHPETQLLNDHSDANYDQAVIVELTEIDVKVQPICADLAAGLQRFGMYGPRFTSAIQKLQSGDLDWFTKPIIESYHTVWFELHEDLLASLGIDRKTEQEQL